MFKSWEPQNAPFVVTHVEEIAKFGWAHGNNAQKIPRMAVSVSLALRAAVLSIDLKEQGDQPNELRFSVPGSRLLGTPGTSPRADARPEPLCRTLLYSISTHHTVTIRYLSFL